MAVLFRLFATLILVFIYRIFLITFVIILFIGFNAFARHMPSVSQELSQLLSWHLDKTFKKAPSNVHIDKLIDKVRSTETRESSQLGGF